MQRKCDVPVRDVVVKRVFSKVVEDIRDMNVDRPSTLVKYNPTAMQIPDQGDLTFGECPELFFSVLSVIKLICVSRTADSNFDGPLEAHR